ncbi:ankyrin repeat domain-containing protein [Chryseobacterium sp.]|uniref:ankyrin repeat domain-containing protein n=1 Tax=Chryseobacterium sp. TaxID=1871047 RepID=UPI0028A0FF5D|nr:ankyrin repeat domain-containing protein [Chryseobacterium sp.]
MRKIYLSLFTLIIITQNCCQKLETSRSTQPVEKCNDLNEFFIQDDGYKYTKLGVACKNNNLIKVKELISKGANINISKTDDIYEFDALYVAIENKHLPVINFLIQQGTDVNKIYTEEGLTPLALATNLNQIVIVELLIKNGANVNPIDIDEYDYKYIPLLTAINNNDIKISELLIKNGAKTDIVNEEGKTIESLLRSKGSNWKKMISKYEK